MSDANRVIITGRLTRDAELRYTPKQTPVTNVTVACNRVFKVSDDEYKEEATFVDVTIWASLAEKLIKKLKQGVHVLVEGRLRNESWEQDGEKRSRLTVVAERVNISPSNKRSGDSDVPFKV